MLRYDNDLGRDYAPEDDDSTLDSILATLSGITKGGSGSGNFGHAGRPGERGWSAANDTGGGTTETPSKPISTVPQPQITAGIAIKHDEQDYDNTNKDRHQLIKNQLEKELSLIPEAHRKLYDQIIIDDNIANNTTETTGEPAFVASESRSPQNFKDSVIAYTERGTKTIVFNAGMDRDITGSSYAETIIHETGHKVFDAQVLDKYDEIKSHSGVDAAKEYFGKWGRLLGSGGIGQEVNMSPAMRLLQHNELSTSAQERAAGLYRVYVTRGLELKDRYPKVYEAVKNEWFGGKEYRDGKEINKQADTTSKVYDYLLPNGIRVYLTEPQPELEATQDRDLELSKGGAGSGNFGHSGRPGEVGGSGDGGEQSISADTPKTGTPKNLENFSGVKEYLGSGTKLIISAEKSNLRPEENNARSIGLKRVLQNYGEVVEQEGQWGGTKERSYVVALKGDEKSVSTALKDLQDLSFSSKELDQEAIVVIQDGAAKLLFNSGKSQTGKISELADGKNAADNYSRIGDVKYRINFKD